VRAMSRPLVVVSRAPAESRQEEARGRDWVDD
jgi:hypothetical protein